MIKIVKHLFSFDLLTGWPDFELHVQCTAAYLFHVLWNNWYIYTYISTETTKNGLICFYFTQNEISVHIFFSRPHVNYSHISAFFVENWTVKKKREKQKYSFHITYWVSIMPYYQMVNEWNVHWSESQTIENWFHSCLKFHLVRRYWKFGCFLYSFCLYNKCVYRKMSE